MSPLAILCVLVTMVAWSLLATVVESVELVADADNDLLFLAWDNPLFSGSLVDYATICPTVFSALVLAAYAMCSGSSTVDLLVRASRGAIRGIAGSPFWHALVKGDLLGLVLLALGTTFDMTLSLIRPQWADRIYADLAIHQDVPVVVAVLLPSALMVGCLIAAPSLLAYGSGMLGVFMDNTGVQSPRCHNLEYLGVPAPYSGQRDVAFRRLFCEGELAGFELAEWWEEFVETQLYNWERFQLVAFTTVLAVVAIFFIAEWAFIEIQRDSTCVAWLDTLASAPTTDNGDTVANEVGTPVESRPSGTHHSADQTTVSTTKDAATSTDADNNLAVMDQMASRIRDLERVNSTSTTTVTRLQAETYDLAYELMTKNQSLLTTQEECANLESLLAQQRELQNTNEARMTNLQKQIAALVSSNNALQEQVAAQSLQLQEQAAQQPVAATIVAPVEAPVVTTPIQELEAPVAETSVMMVDSRPQPTEYHHHHYHHEALRSDKRLAAQLRRQLQRARRQRRNLIAGNSKCREQLSAKERAMDDAAMALEAQLKAVSQLKERNEAQLRTIAALEMENNERDAEVADFEKQHDAYVADLKRRLADQTAVVESLWGKAREKDGQIAELEGKLRSQSEAIQDKDSKVDVTESMYQAFLEERDEDIEKKDKEIQRQEKLIQKKDKEIQRLKESKDTLSQELEQSKQKLEQTTKDYNVQRAQVLKNANTIEKLRRRVQQEGQATQGGQPISRGAPQPTNEEPREKPAAPGTSQPPPASS
ncbi:hypothetical protein TEQG_05803 [Trichophyton equinum CBS 127.97]|uniref:Uncharacterized protein n=1 Tax=Trichophyton equinum (strain ATCC MYA-4606 / CBS 127.97) TaxID=559882 RepID=F2PY43_TRIEC|nr:hypothetical protein TEQG_05803 [Trichophyton equinum CBS 127.97]